MSATLESEVRATPSPTTRNPPTLRNGDRMSQAEFHQAYEQMADDVKAELIEGVVFMASPLGIDHGRRHVHLGTVLTLYEAATPGVQVVDNSTTILGEDDEPQPDLSLRILPERGG